MTRAIHLTLAQVKKAGLLAYHEKRLSAQGPTPSCMYRDRSDRPCVVGASLDKTIANSFDSMPMSSVRVLVSRRELAIDRAEEVAALQGAHDGWVAAARGGDAQCAANAEAKFLALLEGREP